ncbi:hypothetical protein SDC9_172814 [bioreactor metagenome]|uniref:Uncharacterized protein n=1 Tax=bioreactor metagenome TaxID=1076179 RepID=A0A645GFD7_9ZZZZ
MVIDQAPQLGVVLADLPGHGPDRHVLHKGEYHPLHHQGETAAASGPGNLNGPHLAVGGDDPGNLRRDVAAILEEIEMPPGSLPGVMNLALLFNPRVIECRPFCEINLDMQFHQ